MKSFQQPILCSVLIDPHLALNFNLRQWDLLIRQARSANLLARLGYLFESVGLLNQLPARALTHIMSAQVYADRFYIALQREISCIKEALNSVNAPLVLLKGSAYFMAGNIAANGRLFSDVDILVPEDKLSAVEEALIKAGWMTNTIDPYDQKYYRQWMHEIPPLRHLKRHTSIDVHHNILPKTNRFYPDSNKLFANSVKIPDHNIWILAPEDRVLHSAMHLFHEGEFTQGLRDLSDLDLLLKEFSIQESFWKKLLLRSTELQQQIPLFYALRYSHRILQTPVPESVLKASKQPINTILMDALFLRALLPDHNSCNDKWTGLARSLLFIRSHYLKMPICLMVPHLLRKTYRRILGKELH